MNRTDLKVIKLVSYTRRFERDWFEGDQASFIHETIGTGLI